MALASRIGNLLKQTVSKHTNLVPKYNPSLYQAIRCMSSSKLFVGGLPYATDEMTLREVFAQYGNVVEAKIVKDNETGRSRGFGFVSYTSSEEASSAIQALDCKDFQGRWLKVVFAMERPRGGGFDGYDYGDGGGGASNTSASREQNYSGYYGGGNYASGSRFGSGNDN